MKRSNFLKLSNGLKCMLMVFIGSSLILSSCQKDDEVVKQEEIQQDINIVDDPNARYTTTQTISDEAQRNTIAFDALGFMVGDVGAQTFLPPGKVADYSGFQYLRDNDPTNLGHNTSFVTIIANNVLNILTKEQIQIYVDAANVQISMINEYAYKRFPLCKAFRRLIEGDLPSGKTELDLEAVKTYSAALYKIDGEISYNRAQLFGQIISSLSSEQKAKLDALKTLKGIGNWNSTLSDPLKDLKLQRDVNVAVMTYASEMYAWYAGSVTADVYFCPERQGTYFGSFYLKDWPAMGNPNYTIDEQLTANAGQNFLKILSADQSSQITGLVDLQKTSLTALVDVRKDISIELRKFLSGSTASSSTVSSLSEDYGKYDGEIIYLYATYFSKVYKSLSADQKNQVLELGNKLGYINPKGAFLYSEPIDMPTIENTDYLFK